MLSHLHQEQPEREKERERHTQASKLHESNMRGYRRRKIEREKRVRRMEMGERKKKREMEMESEREKRRGRQMLQWHTHKAISATFACLSVCYYDCFFYFAKCFEEFTQALVSCMVRKSSNKYLGQSSIFVFVVT